MSNYQFRLFIPQVALTLSECWYYKRLQVSKYNKSARQLRTSWTTYYIIFRDQLTTIVYMISQYLVNALPPFEQKKHMHLPF